MANLISFFEKKIKNLFSNGFVKSVAILAGGTIAAQALMVMVLPILTRFYSPSEFGILAMYASLLLMLSVASGLRLEIAIPIVPKKTDAVHLTLMALGCVVVVSLLVALVVLLFSNFFLRVTNKAEFQPYVWLVPVGVLASGFYMVLQYWATRQKAFKLISKTKLRQALSAVSIQVGVGFFLSSAFGLLIGHLVSGVAGLVSLLMFYITTSKLTLKRVSLSRIRSLFLRNIDLIRYSTLEAFCNTAGLQLPVVMIATFAIGSEAGFLFLATRLMVIPMTLVGHATAQVFLSNAGAKHQAGELADFTRVTIVGLAKAGIGPLLFLGIVAPVIVPFVFGLEWVRSGVLVTWMVPWFVMQFITSPVSMILYVTQNQRRAFFLQLIGLVLRAGSVGAACLFLTGWVSEVYAISGFIFYFLYFIVILRTMKYSALSLLRDLRFGVPIVFGWVVFALVVIFVFKALAQII